MHCNGGFLTISSCNFYPLYETDHAWHSCVMMALYKLCLVISTYFPHTIGTKGVTRCIEVYKSPPLSSLLPCDFFPVFEILQTHVDTTVTDLFFAAEESIDE